LAGKEDAQEIVRVPLGAIGGGEHGRDGGQGRVPREAAAQDDIGPAPFEAREGLEAGVGLAGPERAPAHARRLRGLREGTPLVQPAADHHRRRERPRIDGVRRDARLPAGGKKGCQGFADGHRSPLPLMRRVASSNQRASVPGMERPSQSTSTRCTITGTELTAMGCWPSGAAPNTMGCRCRNSPANATANPMRSGTVSHGHAFMVAVSSRNSLVNTPKGGNPAMAMLPNSRPQPTAGCVRMSPRIFSMRCVFAIWL